ncbi:MAG: cupin domain-containing protein [Deltaproteobacteria bacterium]|nr:cupin domain-containing protein [Deltaproteobacteria bacterium]
MKHLYCPEVESLDALSVGRQGAEKMKLKFLSEDSVWIEIEPGGHTPDHKHDDKERLVIISGEGKIKLGEELKEIHQNDFIEFHANELHQIINTSEELLVTMCFRNQP